MSSASNTRSSRPVALVTGGARRVGRAVIEALASRGYAVVIHANRSRAEADALAAGLAAAGSPAMAVLGDVADESLVRAWVGNVFEQFGRIDVVVNSAAIWNKKPLEEIAAADVRAHFETNTLGTFLVCRHFGLAMVGQAEGGAIVNIGDWATSRPYADYAAYFASKGAIPTLTRMFAVELARRNPRVRVNAILPGPVMLPSDLPAADRAASIAGTLVHREGSAVNVAQAVVSLVENEFITGVCLPVDGGRTIAP